MAFSGINMSRANDIKAMKPLLTNSSISFHLGILPRLVL
jgi:hypothetical protein